MTREEIKRRVKDIFTQIFPETSKSTFNFDATEDTYKNWDSFTHMEIMAGIEKEFGIHLNGHEMMAVNTASACVTIIEKKLNES